MSDFTMQAWQDALGKVYARATIDGDFRQRCLENPRAAIKEVAEDLELPLSFRVVFLDKNTDSFQPLLLPPLLQSGTCDLPAGVAQAMADWHVHFHTGSQACHTTGGGGGGTHPTITL